MASVKSQAEPPKTRNLLMDDHALLRRGLKALLDAEPDVRCCAPSAACLRGGLHASGALDAHLRKKFLAGGKLGQAAGLELLSTHELEVFKLIGSGSVSCEIARVLGLSVKTIQSHRENLKAKLKLPS